MCRRVNAVRFQVYVPLHSLVSFGVHRFVPWSRGQPSEGHWQPHLCGRAYGVAQLARRLLRRFGGYRATVAPMRSPGSWSRDLCGSLNRVLQL